MREGRLAVDELVPAGDRCGLERHARAASRAALRAGRRSPRPAARGPEYVSRKFVERRQRPFGAQVEAPFLRRGGREIVALASASSTLKLSIVDAREVAEPRVQLLGREVQLVGRQHRALDVVPAFLVTLGDARARRAPRRRRCRRRRTPRCPSVDSRAACRWYRRTAAGRTRCRAARGRR